jgi:hypothetical protein
MQLMSDDIKNIGNFILISQKREWEGSLDLLVSLLITPTVMDGYLEKISKYSIWRPLAVARGLYLNPALILACRSCIVLHVCGVSTHVYRGRTAVLVGSPVPVRAAAARGSVRS